MKLIKVHGIERCRILRRLNRFVVEVDVNGRGEMVHITNTGRLNEYLTSGREGLLVPIGGVKLRHRLIGVRIGDYYALIDTRLQNVAFEHLVSNGLIPWLEGYRIVKRSPRLGSSLLDYELMDSSGRRLFIETKSAVLRGPNGESMYPDCPSIRGRRHIKEIIDRLLDGWDALIVFIAGLKDVRCFKPYRDGDPEIHKLLGELYKVEPCSIKCISIYLSIYLSNDGYIYLDNPDVSLCRDWVSTIPR